MTAREVERLTRVEQKQEDSNKRLESVEDKLDVLIAKFDQLSGGKQALMWITGIALTIAGLVVAVLNFQRRG